MGSEQGGIPDVAIWSPRRRRRGRHPRDRSGRRSAGPAAARGADLGLARVRGARARDGAGRRGQVRQGARPRHPDHHRPLRLQDPRRQRPGQPAGPRHVPAARDPRPERLLAGRGHGHRRPPQPDHRRARPASRQRRPGELPRHRHARRRRTANPGCRSGFYVISYARSGEPASRWATSSTCPPATRSAASTAATTSGRAGRRAATTWPTSGPFTPGGRGDGRPIWVTDLRNPANPKVFPEPIDLWRNDGADRLLARRRRRRERHRLDERSRRPARLRDAGQLARSADRTTMRKATPWDPILVAGGGIEGGPDGVAQPQTDFIHNAARPLERQDPRRGRRRTGTSS